MPDSEKQQPQLAVITIHDACPSFSSKIFKFIEQLETLDIRKKRLLSNSNSSRVSELSELSRSVYWW